MVLPQHGICRENADLIRLLRKFSHREGERNGDKRFQTQEEQLSSGLGLSVTTLDLEWDMTTILRLMNIGTCLKTEPLSWPCYSPQQAHPVRKSSVLGS